MAKSSSVSRYGRYLVLNRHGTGLVFRICVRHLCNRSLAGAKLGAAFHTLRSSKLMSVPQIWGPRCIGCSSPS